MVRGLIVTMTGEETFILKVNYEITSFQVHGNMFFYCLKSLIKNFEKFTSFNLTNNGFCCLYCTTVKWFFYPFIFVITCTQQYLIF